jgi:hypothetical protein
MIDKYEELTIEDWYKMNHHDWEDVCNEHKDLQAEIKRLREGLQEIVSDFDTKKTDKWRMLNRIKTILKGDD